MTNSLRGWRRPLVIGVSVLLVALVAAAISFYYNPLPSDAVMIAHYNAHRAELIRLVDHFRNYERPSNVATDWNSLPEIVPLRESSGVRTIGDVGGVWMPDPYSAQTAQHLRNLAKTDGRAYFALKRRFGSLSIRLSVKEYGPRIAIIGMSTALIWKEFFFFPLPPKVEEGRLLEPADTDGKLKSSERVFADLSRYPPEWRKGECVFRLIEPQWFIRMCWGAT